MGRKKDLRGLPRYMYGDVRAKEEYRKFFPPPGDI